MNRAVFLDRDGTLIEDKHYLHRPEQVALFPGAPAALRQLQNAGFLLFIVSNQSGVGRGLFPLSDVHRVHQHLAALLAPAGVAFHKIYVAPEAPDAPSPGRKPSPQFLFDAQAEFHLHLPASYFIGDKLIDLQTGWNAGLRRSILVRTGYGAQTEHQAAPHLARAVILDDLPAAANWILADARTFSP